MVDGAVQGVVGASRRNIQRRYEIVPRVSAIVLEKVVALWPYVDYVAQRQIDVSARDLDQQYAVADILTYCHSCSFRNATSKFFDVRLPSLRAYQHGQG